VLTKIERRQKRFCQGVFLGVVTKLAKLGEMRTEAIFGSYKEVASDKIGATFSHFCHPY
jgi:hypothetical protein